MAKKKSNKSNKVLFVLLTIALLAVILFFFVSKFFILHKNPSRSDTSSGILLLQPAEIPPDWKTAIDTRGGLELKYPSNWYANIDQSSNLNLRDSEQVYSRITLIPIPQQHNSQTNIIYEKCAFSYQKSCDERLKDIMNIDTRNVKNGAFKKIKFRNYDGLQFTGEAVANEQGATIPTKYTFIRIGDNLLTITSAQNTPIQYHDQILSSIKFTN